MNLRQTIEEIVEKHLPDASHFVVDIQIVEKGPKKSLHILIDADQGITIETCALVSRAVGEEIEAKELMDTAYVMEVSSPGVDFPLSSRRQYQKNVGRSLKVTLENNDTIEGKLTEVDQRGIRMVVMKKEKGKKAVEESLDLPFEQIRKSIVVVSFK
ncbi:ribosome maturation factor RimP [Cyclobacterium jeungdonense]|uniref:Ribosome maturation factor RimP n=1 Tax=Cyclobacterium jeungdonense TaxID=708087 RepID=A0ABT8C5W2_9BACT|nr:ribosome maturation factor RimP [Cyclobacterium jeungdonense]MDN3687767.1 ribosome maturation factor RimP [Cyclobacterium jeungdonense]